MAEIDSIRCMQLPIEDAQLLLPNSAVAEIIGYMQPEAQNQEGDWFVGFISWRGVMVPVISIEKLCQRSYSEPGPRSRIAIIYNPDGEDNLPYLGIILKDIPRAYLAEKDRLIETVVEVDCPYLASRADALLEELIVPNLDAIIGDLGSLLRKH